MNSKLYFKISGIVAIAVVAAIVGTLSFTSLETNSDSATHTQSVGIGAYVTVEAYHEDGTLYQKWEGHNFLTDTARSFLTICISGINPTDGVPLLDGVGCIFRVNDIFIEFDQSQHNAVDEAEVSFIDNIDCDNDALFKCVTGWELKGVFNFDALECDEGIDCPSIVIIHSEGEFQGNGDPFQFNTIVPDPMEVGPNDKVIVTMTFDIPT